MCIYIYMHILDFAFQSWPSPLRPPHIWLFSIAGDTKTTRPSQNKTTLDAGRPPRLKTVRNVRWSHETHSACPLPIISHTLQVNVNGISSIYNAWIDHGFEYIYIYTIYIFTMVMGYTTKTNLSTLNVLQALHFLKHIHICVFKIYVLKHIHICVSKRNDKNIFDLNIKWKLFSW